MAKKGFDLAALARSAMRAAQGEREPSEAGLPQDGVPPTAKTFGQPQTEALRPAAESEDASPAVSNLDTASPAVSSLDTRYIPAPLITANEANFYEMSDLEALAASIELTGLLHPVLVRPDGDGAYRLIDGERRFRAMTEVLGWDEIPAIVRVPVNEVIEELMLIEANRQQRKMTAGELSKQAERYTELLTQLRDAGVEIPGRLRDAVAEAMQVSASKLARLHAIRERLEPGLLAMFDDGDLTESVAYELSRYDHMTQLRVAYCEAAGAPEQHRELTADLVRRLAEADAAETRQAAAPEPVSKLDTASPAVSAGGAHLTPQADTASPAVSSVEWHEIDPDHKPLFDFKKPVLLWGPAGLRSVPQHLIYDTIKFAPETVTHWAVINGPEAEA